MDYSLKLSKEFNLRENHAANIISLIDDGNTIPFIARYRKEQTGSCDDQVLREFSDRLKYLRNLDKRKQEIADSITEQGKMTDEIMVALAKAETLTEAEDIYRPYKQLMPLSFSFAYMVYKYLLLQLRFQPLLKQP